MTEEEMTTPFDDVDIVINGTKVVVTFTAKNEEDARKVAAVTSIKFQHAKIRTVE